MPEKFVKIKAQDISFPPAKKPDDWFAPAQTQGKATDIEDLVGKDGAKWLTNNMNMIGWTSDKYMAAILKHADEIQKRSDLLWETRGKSIDESNPELFGVGASFKLFTSKMDKDKKGKGILDKDKFLASAKKYAEKNTLFDADQFYNDVCAVWDQLGADGGEATIGRYIVKNVKGDLKVSGTITKEELTAMIALTYVMQEWTGISADLFQAVAMQETHFNYYASSSAGVGLFQITKDGAGISKTSKKDKDEDDPTKNEAGQEDGVNDKLVKWGHAAFDDKLGNVWDGASGKFTDEWIVEKKYKKNKDGSFQLDDDGNKKFDWVRADGFIGSLITPDGSILYAALNMIADGARPPIDGKAMTDDEIKAMALKYNASATKEEYASNVVTYYNYLKNL